MPVARFETDSGEFCQMLVDGEEVEALAPEELGLRVPFQFQPSQPTAPDRLTWDLSYLYAELWSPPDHGSRYFGAILPEFSTRDYYPSVMRLPIGTPALALIEEMRQGGDLQLVLRIQATLVGTVPRDQVQDAARRRTLETWGLSHEMIGPARCSDDLLLYIPRTLWEERVLPQWMGASIPLIGSRADTPVLLEGGRLPLDIQALARTLAGATIAGDPEAILRQCRPPIVGL